MKINKEIKARDDPFAKKLTKPIFIMNKQKYEIS